MENVIVTEGGTIKGWMFSEESMALVIFIVWYFQNKMETWYLKVDVELGVDDLMT